MGDGIEAELSFFGDFKILNQYFFTFIMAIMFCYPIFNMLYHFILTRDRWEMSPQRIPKNLGDREYIVAENIDALSIAETLSETPQESDTAG